MQFQRSNDVPISLRITEAPRVQLNDSHRNLHIKKFETMVMPRSYTGVFGFLVLLEIVIHSSFLDPPHCDVP